MAGRMAVVKGAALAGAMMTLMTLPAAAQMVTIEKSYYGPYGGKAFVVANSEGGWHRAMKALENAGNLAILPAPEPPAGVDWAHEVVMVISAGATGYDVELTLSPAGRGKVKVDPQYVQLVGQDGGESLPYHVVKMPKHSWLQDLTAQGDEVDAVLPIIGSDDSVPAGATSWGGIKAAYR